MRKKFTRNMSGCGLTNGTNSSPIRSQQSESRQRHSYSGTSSHAVDERYAKYFGIPAKNTVAITNATITTTSTTHDSLQERRTTSNNGVVDEASSRTKTQLKTQRHIDFDEFLSDELSSKPSQPASVLAAVNENVRQWNDKVLSSGSAVVKRRDAGVKRNRPLTAVVTGAPTSNPGEGYGGVSVSVTGTPLGRSALRSGRALTITHGIPYIQQLPEVKKFEDITVTKEEFQLASKEFERIFLGIA